MEQKKPLSICALCAHAPICKNPPQQSCPHLLVKDQKRSPVERKDPVKPKTSFWRKLRRMLLCFGVVILMIAAFAAGRISLHPQISPFIPNLTPPQPLTPEDTPDRLVHYYFDAVKRSDMTRVLELFDTSEVKSHGEHFVSEATQLAEVLPTLLNIQILKVETEATATVFVNLVDNQNRTETGTFRLKMIDGQWRIVNCDF